MRQPTNLALVAALALAFSGCSASGSGQPVPPLPSDFQQGATIPGAVLTLPMESRGDVVSRSTHAQGQWTVILERPMRSRPRDINFAVAISDNGLSHSGVSNVRFTSNPNESGDAQTVVARRVQPGAIVLDGVATTAEWPNFNYSNLSATPQNGLPTGFWPAPGNVTIDAQAAYDDDYVHFVFRWTDPSSTRSNLGALLQWNGTEFTPRPHRANDANGNGVVDPGEAALIGAPAEDEDRLLLFWPIEDFSGSFREGQPGCAASCHQNQTLSGTGSEAVHALLSASDRVDVWSFRAATGAPGGRMDDGVLVPANPALGLTGGGSGLRSDSGAASFVPIAPSSPAFMYATPQTSFTPLILQSIDFTSSSAPGASIPTAIAANAAVFQLLDFNGTGAPPTPWNGQAPSFNNNFLPPVAFQPATGSRADVICRANFANNRWTVELRRRRDVSNDGDDVDFEDDADFRRRAFEVTSAVAGLPFSISLTDSARGHGVRETEYRGPIRLANDASLQGTALTDSLVLVDYGPSFQPNAASNFGDGRQTIPVATSGVSRNLKLKAGTNGGEKLFVLATWDDPTQSTFRDQWTWNGFTWGQGGDEDEARFLFGNGDPASNFATQGCGSACHQASGGSLTFRSTLPGEFFDAWTWRAGRTARSLSVDDLFLGFQGSGSIEGGASGAFIKPDAGRAPYTPNHVPGQSFPVYMASSDPNTFAAAIGLSVPGVPEAIPFIDVAGNLPPPPPGGGSGISFAGDVLPIFQARCFVCHPPLGGLNLQSYAGVLAGGMTGPVVLPGNPTQSILIRRLRGLIQPQMPLGGQPLEEAQIATIASWIAAGAPNN